MIAINKLKASYIVLASTGEVHHLEEFETEQEARKAYNKFHGFLSRKLYKVHSLLEGSLEGGKNEKQVS